MTSKPTHLIRNDNIQSGATPCICLSTCAISETKLHNGGTSGVGDYEHSMSFDIALFLSKILEVLRKISVLLVVVLWDSSAIIWFLVWRLTSVVWRQFWLSLNLEVHLRALSLFTTNIQGFRVLVPHVGAPRLPELIQYMAALVLSCV